ncbi:Zn-dependent hydrolase [Acetobacter sp. TBRC 12305]|uniref:Zn-dependent hydrolase n=1 Tax=Acetobacter garciniae TaxID=2817435 RepID=A0A939HL64_9PROT|nr:Zn-dependent hydrolase [Acetobacter garciniae]MBO1326450.1 Zn-dependent hydrolase [Acetobacter garciniae]MBX0346095.1 Zn-dependent hydrolase [Acetobacter garciniae]
MTVASHVRSDRLQADIDTLATITDPARPHTRRSFSPRFLEGREWLAARFQQAGLSTRMDEAGNLIGRRAGTVPGRGTIMSGSHSDTVPDGGRFDGILGVLAALEVARAFDDAGISLCHDLEIVDFLAEEPSDFGLSCIGSRGMAGALSAEHRALRAPWDENLAAALTRMGGNASLLDTPRRTDIRAFFELHIEQGIVLESEQVQIGVVDAIAGVTRLEIVFSGRADHAGTTPMDLRRDAAVPAAAIIGFVHERASALARAGGGHVTATCGVLELSPGASNVIPRAARLVVDIRVSERAVAEDLVAAIRTASEDAARASRTTLSRFAIQSDTSPTPCDPALAGLVETAARTQGFSTRHMVSGAGHDAAFVARLAPMAMIFVPCRDGRSHDPEEWCTAEDAARGTMVLAGAMELCDRKD